MAALSESRIPAQVQKLAQWANEHRSGAFAAMTMTVWLRTRNSRNGWSFSCKNWAPASVCS